MERGVKKMWVIFIITFIGIVFIATLVIAASIWIIHKVLNAIELDNQKLKVDKHKKEKNKKENK